MRLIKDHILRNVNGDVVLVTLSNDETDFNGMIVCRMIEEDTDIDSVITALADEYDLEPEKVENDVRAFLSELDACHVLIK